MNWLVSSTFLDRNATVHLVALDAAIHIVQIHGKGKLYYSPLQNVMVVRNNPLNCFLVECMTKFATLIESNLDQPGDTAHSDRVRESCVVLMGCLARHIDPKDARVKSIFATLLDALSTPSEKACNKFQWIPSTLR